MTTDVDEGRIRAAAGADASVIGQIVEDAYRHYIPRIGKPPGPMLDDYSARVAEGVVWVIEDRSAIAGIIVLLPREGYLLLDNIAVAPARQGAGLGRRLLAFAEVEAVRRGYREIRLYTHRTMTENQRLYAAVGYEETGRGTEAGYERVFMRKRLVGSSVPLGERLDLSDPQRTTLMTSSARAKNRDGNCTPIARAVLRLSTNSNFVGCSTGRSAGFAPLRIRST